MRRWTGVISAVGSATRANRGEKGKARVSGPFALEKIKAKKRIEPSLALLHVFCSPPGGVLSFEGPKKRTKEKGLEVAPPSSSAQESDRTGSAPDPVVRSAPSQDRRAAPPLRQLLGLARILWLDSE